MALLALALTGCPADDSTATGDESCGCPELPDLAGPEADVIEADTTVAEPALDVVAEVGPEALVEVVQDVAVEVIPEVAPETVGEVPAEVAAEVAVEVAIEVAAEIPVEVAAPTFDPISPADLYAALDNKDFLLINVHVPVTTQVPKTDTHITYLDVPAIEAYIGSNLDTKVIVYCMSNYMSGIAGTQLVADGYRAIRYLDGGMGAWTQAGYSLEPTP